MKKKEKIIQIPINRILFNDFTYSVWAWSDYSKVKKSIQLAGMQTMPVVIQSEKDGYYCIVSGQKRFRALKDIGVNNVACILFSRPDNSCQLFINTLLENLSFREYNIVEKGMIFNRLHGVSSCGYDIEKLMGNLGANTSNLHKIKRLGKLPSCIKKDIACGKVKQSVALILADISEEDQAAFVNLLKFVDFGKNKQKDVFNLLFDLSKINACSFDNILSDKEVQGVLSSRQLNAPQKGGHILNFLREKRLPNFYKFNKQFNRIKSAINLPANIKLQNNPPFEDDDLRIEISVKNSDDLVKMREWMNRFTKNKEVCEIIDMIRGC